MTLVKQRPQGRRSSNQINNLITQKQQQMERSSLTIREEKAALQEMRKMRADSKVIAPSGFPLLP